MRSSSERVYTNSRRRILTAIMGGLAISVSGCFGGDDGSPNGTSPSETTTSTSGLDEMPEGSVIVEVTVGSRFDGHTVLEPNCREEEVSIEPGERASIERRTAGETCSLRLDIDGEHAFDAEVYGYESYHLTVTEDGTIETELVER